jgi:hypothetical protein
MTRIARYLLPILSAATLAACLSDPLLTTADTTELAVGQTREVTLRGTRFDVKRFEKRLTRSDMLKLPVAIREAMWLMDLNLSGSASDPALFDHALDAIKAKDPDSPELSVAEANLVRLLTMTPDTADLRGTALEPLLDLSVKIGLSPEQILADAMGIGTTDPFLSTGAVKDAILGGVVGTHPNARARADGTPVAPGHLPVTLEDALTDMRSLASRYGPYARDGQFHPGFLLGATEAPLLTDDFAMSVRVGLNALPLKGVDLTSATVANVNSIGLEPEGMFDFDDADWLRIEGLAPGGPRVTTLTFAIGESPQWLAAGDSRLPWPTGNGEVWSVPPWTLERVVADAARARWGSWDLALDYHIGAAASPVASVDIEDGWFSTTTKANLGSPPPPLYIWDLLVEVVQTRMHDAGPGAPPLAEGEATVQFALEDLEIGLDNDGIIATLKDNLRRDPSALVEAARFLFANGDGAPDIYYVRSPPQVAESLAGDWLYFVAAADIAQADDGTPVRDINAYSTVGFFLDEGLTQRLSSRVALGGDTAREKVRVSPGDQLYVADDDGRTYRIVVGAKTGFYTLNLLITRVR